MIPRQPRSTLFPYTTLFRSSAYCTRWSGLDRHAALDELPDLSLRVREGAQDLAGVLAELRRRGGRRLGHAGDADRAVHGREAPEAGVLELGQEAVGPELRIARDLRIGRQDRERDVVRLETRPPVHRVLGGEDHVEGRDELLDVRAPSRGLGEARIGHEVGTADDPAEAGPELLRIHEGELQHAAVARPVVHGAEAPGALAWELGRERRAAELGLDVPRVRPGTRGEERGAHLEAAAGALTREEGEHDRAEEGEGGRMIAGAAGELPERALGREEARLEPRARPVDNRVVARLLRLRPRLAEPRGARVDKARVERREVLPAELELLEGGGAEVRQEDIGGAGQPVEDRDAVEIFQIERDAPLRA